MRKFKRLRTLAYNISTGAPAVDLPESAWEQGPAPSNRLVGKKNCRYQGAIALPESNLEVFSLLKSLMFIVIGAFA